MKLGDIKRSMIDISKAPITADELVALYHIYEKNHFYFDLEDCFDLINKAVDILTEATKIEDASPTINGTWLPASDGDGIVCSNCGNDFCTVFISAEKWNYCPICGSKMRYKNEAN